jgi:biopolymer transport protein ExbD
MSRKPKKRKLPEAGELNLAAMLDMAFQMLAFFILTFKPAPVEGEVLVRLPPPQPVTGGGRSAAGENTKLDISQLKALKTLTISIIPNAQGQIGTNSMQVGDVAVGTLARLNERLKTALQEGDFEQVIIQAGSGLHYDALMSVVDVCTTQKLKDGQPLQKLSFVELPTE